MIQLIQQNLRVRVLLRAQETMMRTIQNGNFQTDSTILLLILRKACGKD